MTLTSECLSRRHTRAHSLQTASPMPIILLNTLSARSICTTGLTQPETPLGPKVGPLCPILSILNTERDYS